MRAINRYPTRLLNVVRMTIVYDQPIYHSVSLYLAVVVHHCEIVDSLVVIIAPRTLRNLLGRKTERQLQLPAVISPP